MDNACDASDNFRDKNAGLKDLAKKNVNTTNVTLLFHIRKAFKSAKETYPSINMSASQISKLEDAIMRFVYMSKMKWVTAIKARTGAERAGDCMPAGTVLKHPIAGLENSTADFHGIFSNLCYTKLTSEETERIMRFAPEMLAAVGQEGRLTNALMDELGIAKLTDGVHRDRDDLCLTQQGPVCITHFQTLARETMRASRKENLAQQKAVETARALLDAARSAELKLATVAHAKQAEATRVAALTPAQRQAETAAKKVLANVKKAASNFRKRNIEK